MSTISFDKTSLGEIICEMQQNDKIDDKFKIVNSIKDLRMISVFWKIPSKPIKKICNDKSYVPNRSFDTPTNNFNNENSLNDNYDGILSSQSFTDRPINFKDQIKMYLIIKLL